MGTVYGSAGRRYRLVSELAAGQLNQ
jgi:hypothetical protein